MKVHTLKSLGAKLFYLMTALVLITVAGNSWQFFRTFRAYQLQQMQDSLQSQAERAKDQIENSLENWRSQIAVALPTLRGTDTKDPQAALQRFIDANQEFVFIQLLTAPSADSLALRPLGEAMTSHTGDKNFEDKEPAKIVLEAKTAATLWLKTQIPHLKKTNFSVESLGRDLNLPVMVMATRFEVAGSSEVVWAVLGTWQTNLMRALLKSSTISSVVLDTRGRIFASLDPAELLGKRAFGSKTLQRKVLSSSSPSGFESEYLGAHNRARVGAFAKLQRYPLAVIIEQDADAATQTVNRTLVSTSLWAALFVLFAILFSFIGSSGITRGLRAVVYATSRIANGDLQYQIATSSQDEVGALCASVNHMAGRMAELMRSQVDKARFEKELETAKMVQSTFFPKEAITRPQLQVAGFYTPASECGGDLWGHFTIGEGLEFLFIADAMGHGAPAALVTAMAYSTTMTVADIIRTESSYRDSPGALLERINRIIHEAVGGAISMTFFASIIDLNKGTLTYANAGHNFPVVLPMDATDSRLGKPSKSTQKSGGVQAISLKLMGTPLGIDPVATFKEQSFDFKAGDKLFYFTDGLIECVSPKGEQWGRKHLLAEVGLGASLGPKQLCDNIVKKAFAFFGGVPLADDITVVVAEIGKTWQKKAGDLPVELAPAPITPVDLVPAPATPPAPAPREAQALIVELEVETQAVATELASLQAAMPPPPAPEAPIVVEAAPVQSKPQAPGKYKLKLPRTG